MTARLTAFLIWGAVAATLVYWLLQFGVVGPAVPPHAVPTDTGAAARGDWSRLLGRDAPAAAPDEPAPADPGLASRFRLLGVVAPKSAARPEGVALIAVDDGPPRAYRVGAPVDGQTVLQSVHRGGAALGPLGGPAQVRLELPALPPPATGTLPSPGTQPPVVAAPGMRGPALPRPLVRPPAPPPIEAMTTEEPEPGSVQDEPQSE